MREDVAFDAEGVTLRGWLYLPDGAGGPVPTVVMAHGFSAVKEMHLDDFAEAFALGGPGALACGHPNFGRAGGGHGPQSPPPRARAPASPGGARAPGPRQPPPPAPPGGSNARRSTPGRRC